jgi:hypothetical protein
LGQHRGSTGTATGQHRDSIGTASGQHRDRVGTGDARGRCTGRWLTIAQPPERAPSSPSCKCLSCRWPPRSRSGRGAQWQASHTLRAGRCLHEEQRRKERGDAAAGAGAAKEQRASAVADCSSGKVATPAPRSPAGTEMRNPGAAVLRPSSAFRRTFKREGGVPTSSPNIAWQPSNLMAARPGLGSNCGSVAAWDTYRPPPPPLGAAPLMVVFNAVCTRIDTAHGRESAQARRRTCSGTNRCRAAIGFGGKVHRIEGEELRTPTKEAVTRGLVDASGLHRMPPPLPVSALLAVEGWALAHRPTKAGGVEHQKNLRYPYKP